MRYLLTTDLPDEYIGRLLYLEPTERPGWKQLNVSDNPAESPQPPDGFGVRVRYFLTLRSDNAWCGLVGTVEQEGHLFDRFWIGCVVNYQGYPNFIDRLRNSWCRIGPDRPKEPTLYIPSGLPFYEGSGILGESKAIIAEVCEAKRLWH